VSRTADAVSLALLAGVTLLGVALWPRLPSEMAVHFDASNTPDNYVSKPVGVFLTPAVGVAVAAFTRLSARVDPTADPRTLDAAVAFVGLVVAYVHALVLAWNLGVRYDIGVAVAPVLLGAGGLTVYALHRDGLFG
jgi:uncharacterized membrane protein